MILPFHKELQQQEFRKFIDDQDLLRQIKFFSEVDRIPAFVFESGITSLGNLTSNVVYIDDFGNEISRTELTNNEIHQKLFLGQYLYISNGDILTNELEYCKYYIEIENDLGTTYYSEVVTKIKEQKADGRLQLNSGAFYNLNTGGYILLNTAQDGYILDKLTRIKARINRNYGNSDFSGVELIHYLETRPYLEENFESTTSEENAGEETVFQKVITSIYSLTFFAIESVADNLQNLAFFDEIEITTPENKTYETINRVEVLREERINSSGVYQMKITFQTEYRIDLQVESGLPIIDDTPIDYQVGKLNFSPTLDIDIADFLKIKNTLLEGTGFEAVQCLGQLYLASTYPVLASIMGTFDHLGHEVVLIPDMSGFIPVGSGSFNDKNDTPTYNVTSGQEITDGEYSHKLLSDEMSHFHVISGGGRLEYTAGATVFNIDCFGNLVQGDVTPTRDLTGMNEYDSDTVNFDDLIERYITKFNGETINSNDMLFQKSKAIDRYITTLNDNDPDVEDDRNAHNNIQPCHACFVWTIIDRT